MSYDPGDEYQCMAMECVWYIISMTYHANQICNLYNYGFCIYIFFNLKFVPHFCSTEYCIKCINMHNTMFYPWNTGLS